MRVFGLVLALALADWGCGSSIEVDGGTGGTAGTGGMAGTGACTNAADQAFACSEDNDIKGTLTACGLCSILGLGCPDGCDGNPIAAMTSVADCAAATLGDTACDPGLSQACLDCYVSVSACGTTNCAVDCAADPAGCACLACVNTNCDAGFEACAGYSAGSDTVPGGPPSCEALQTCNPA